MRILGIDPGLQRTGWGVITFDSDTKISHIGSGIIRTNVKDNISTRLLFINEELERIIQAYKPNATAIEDIYVNKNYGSSLKLAYARATALLTIAKSKLSIAEYPAKVIKKNITGSGTSDKKNIIKMINYMLPKVETTSDSADALAIAICHAMTI